MSGEARIQIGNKEAVQRQIVFFETDNVQVMREAVVARGAEPTALEKVKWIKIEMFEIRDPDGHTLWFGQSFDRPDVSRPDRMMRTIMAEMPLDDVSAGVAYYRGEPVSQPWGLREF